MNPRCIVGFDADTNDIQSVAARISRDLFAGLRFRAPTTNRMGGFRGVELESDILGFAVYIVQGCIRPFSYTLELELREPPIATPERPLVLQNGILLSDYLHQLLPADWR